MKILVTGATGFIGRALVPALSDAGHQVVAPSRIAGAGAPSLEEPASYLPSMRDADAVVHLAAHNPPRWKKRPGDAARLRTLNVEATAALGRMATQSDVKIFVFLSSARVYGIGPAQSYSEATPPAPADLYGVSKAEAERALGQIFAGSPSSLTVLRAPVVYDRGRGGVLGLLTRFAKAGLPFPGAFAGQPKSVLYRRNLVSALLHVLETGAGAAETFNICDGPPVTLGEAGAIIARSHGRRFRIAPVPKIFARALSAMPVAGPAFAHLAAPCVLDAEKFRQVTGWTPPVGTPDALAASFGPDD